MAETETTEPKKEEPKKKKDIFGMDDIEIGLRPQDIDLGLDKIDLGI